MDQGLSPQDVASGYHHIRSQGGYASYGTFCPVTALRMKMRHDEAY
jgi:hypothetical protein